MTTTQASKERKKRTRAEVHKLIVQSKEVPCAQCGGDFPSVCMDFDHLPQYTKLFNIGSPSNWTSIQRVKQEIAKCEVVCSNCHRIRTWERKNGRKVSQPVRETPQEPPKQKKFRNLLTRINRWDSV